VAIAAVRKAGRTGRARNAEMKEVVEAIRERQARLGPDAVKFVWVKAPTATRRRTRWQRRGQGCRKSGRGKEWRGR